MQRLRQEYGREVLSVKLYGSKARGDHHEDSDLDLFVRVRQDDRQVYAKMYQIASEIELKYDVILGMLLTGPTHYALMRRLGEPLYRNVQREGVELWTRTPRTLSASEEFVARVEQYLRDMDSATPVSS